MVQRVVPSKLGGILADYAKSDKGQANLKQSSSEHQDGKGRGTDKMNKMKKSRLQSPPSVRSSSQPRKTPPLHVPTTAASTQQRKPLGRTSPNYMKPTTSSDAKKELLPVSLSNTQTGSDGKNLPRKCSSNSKASSVSSTNPAKTLSRSSSLNSVRTLTRTPSFKPCKACLRKSTSTVLFEDMNAPDRATCSSTLKDSKFPAYLMLHPGRTEPEGASVMKVCPYTYCSLNDHGHVSLPPLKSFLSERRHLLETQKNIKPEVVSRQRWKVACDTKKDTDIEQVVFDGKPPCDEADTGNSTTTPLAQEIDVDFFIEIYAKEKEGADELGRFNSVKDLEDQEDINFTNEENGAAAEEYGIKQVTPGVTHDLPKSQINIEKDFKIDFDAVATEANSNWRLHLGQNAEDEDENHPSGWIREETCRESYYNEVSSDGEPVENIELDESDSQQTDMDWEEEQFCAFNHEEDTNSFICSMEETDSKLESLSESSHDISEMWLDDIFSGHYVDILAEEAHQEAEEEKSLCSEAPHSTDSVHEGINESFKLETQETNYPSSVCYEYDQSTLTQEVLEFMTNAEDNNGENDKHVHHEASCVSMVLYEETVENSEGHKTSDTCEIDESQDRKASIENNDDRISQECCEDSKASQVNDDDGISQEDLIHLSNVPEESTTIVQDQKLLEENQDKASKFQSKSCTGGEEQHTSRNWKWATKRKRPVEDDEEMRKINPRKPNFLPLVPDPEPEKINLKHQMIYERKNAEEWMLDFAVRQSVTRLAPEGKRKVALLVQAFETVMSNPKCETHMRNDSPFAHARPIQACS